MLRVFVILSTAKDMLFSCSIFEMRREKQVLHPYAYRCVAYEFRTTIADG